MLSSIHPLGERAKHNRFSRTATAFAVGGVAGGAATGAVAGMLGDLGPDHLGSTLRASVLGLALVVAAALDLAGRRPPGPHRQVDENWLTRYRGWVYGVGYGVQLGIGVTTFVTTAAVYVWILAAFVSGSPILGAVIGSVFGLGRGLSLVWARHVDSTDALIALHRRLQAGDRRVRTASGATLAIVGTVIGALTIGGAW